MFENYKPCPAPVQAIDRLAEALRSELLEYGHLLELLRGQQQMIFAENLFELTGNIGAVNVQMRHIVKYRWQREYWRAETLCAALHLSEPNDSQEQRRWHLLRSSP